MQIYHYHPETHFFVGTSQADPSPLEPGKYLIPAHSTAEPVPEFDPEISRVQWVGGVWQVEAMPPPEPEPPPPPEPELQPDWTGLFLAMQQQWGALMTLATAPTSTLAALLVGRMPNISETGMIALAYEWNTVVNSLPFGHGIDWGALATTAAAHRCDLFAAIDTETGLLGDSL